MLTLIKTNATNEDFRQLVGLLDIELTEIDGEEHDFYHQFNGIDNIRHAVVAYLDGVAVGCGAIKKYDDQTTEIKRMFVRPEHRGQQIASEIVRKLEEWSAELGFLYCVLETGKRQQDAIALYQKNKYEVIPNYGQYVGVENSVCMRKKI